jgi:hypothetical protein
MTPMPTARGYAGAAVSSEKIYIVGGFDGDAALAVNEAYTPDREGGDNAPWVTSTPLPEGRYRFAIVSVAEIIHLIGGMGDDGPNNTSYKFYSLKNEWHGFRVPIDEPWTDFSATTYDNKIYTLGGQINSQMIDQTYSYQAIFTTMIPVLP